MKKRGPKNIEEYVARFCVVALKTKKIKDLEKQLSGELCENSMLKNTIQRYEKEFIHLLEHARSCDNCGEYFHVDDMYSCANRSCNLLCDNCADKKSCEDCGEKGCSGCLLYCAFELCHYSICENCAEHNKTCAHNTCQYHYDPCAVCGITKKKKKKK